MQIGWSVAMRVALLAGWVVLAGAPSRAVPTFTANIDAGGPTLNLVPSDFSCTDSGTLSVCSKTGVSLNGLQFNIALTLDTDPKIFATVDVLNTNVGTTQFTATFTLSGVGTSGISTLTEGGVSGGVTDNDGVADNNGVAAKIATVSGSSFYTALIDNAAYQTLYDFPFSHSAGPFLSSNFPDLSFGPNQGAGPIVNSIGVKLDFTLTGQDSSSFSGTFELKPVPEPGTALLLGLGLIAMAAVERRR